MFGLRYWGDGSNVAINSGVTINDVSSALAIDSVTNITITNNDTITATGEGSHGVRNKGTITIITNFGSISAKKFI